MRKITIFLLIILGSCQLFEPKPESEKFYCKINGKAFRPDKNYISLPRSLSAEWNKKGRFNIYATGSSEDVSMTLKVGQLGVEKQEYKLDSTNSIGYYILNTNTSTHETLKSISGFVNISKIENHEVSGTFEFVVYSDKQKKEYKITKGQFNNLAYTEF